MNWYLIFYLFSLSDKISQTTLILSIVLSILCGISLIVWFINYTDNEEAPVFTKMAYITLPALVLSWILWAGIPNRRDMLLIIAGGAVGEFITTDANARELPSDITKFLRKEILDATISGGDEALKSALGLKTKADSLKELSKEQLIELLNKKK